VRLTVVSVAYAMAPVTRATAGGAEQVLAMIDEALVTRGHRSIVVAQEGSAVAGELLPIPRVDEIFTDDVQRAARERVRQRVAEASAEADVIHLHGIDAPHVLSSASRSSAPTVVTLHLPIEWYPPEFLERTDIEFVCVSESQRERFPHRAHVIPNGIDLRAFVPAASHSDYALSLSRICEEKNLHEAMDAARIAAVDFYLAGSVAAYPSHQSYFHEFVEPRLNDHSRFLGSLAPAEKRDRIANARCVLIPSTVAETSSLVAMEALACGTPVIAYRSGALPEIVRDGVTGFIVDDVRAMADAIREVGRIDRAACRREAEVRFDACRMIDAYLDLYATLRSAAGTAALQHDHRSQSSRR
jgi:glycosyltransferase involved in cell wall biosynthesis